MKNTVKLFGIIALAAVFVLGMVSCGEPEPDPLTVKISVSNGLMNTVEIADAENEDDPLQEIVLSKGASFKATAEGGDGSAYKYQWSLVDLDGDAVELDSATGQSIEVEKAGTYTVKVTCGSENASKSLKVTELSNIAEIFGTWFYKATDAKDNERITFWDAAFAIQDYQEGDKLEYMSFKITTVESVQPSATPLQPEGYPNCYKITGKLDDYNGYTGSQPMDKDASSNDVFYIYLNAAKSELRRINRSNATPRALQPQVYTRTAP